MPYSYTTNKSQKQFKIKIEMEFDSFDSFKGIKKRLTNCINKKLNKSQGFIEDTEDFKINSIEEIKA